MSDLIDRNVATKNLKEWLEQTGVILQGTSYYGELFGCIEDIPTIDAVPVVRCEECENRGKKYQCPMMKAPDDAYFGSYTDETVDDDFCSYGEKKAESVNQNE